MFMEKRQSNVFSNISISENAIVYENVDLGWNDDKNQKILNE